MRKACIVVDKFYQNNKIFDINDKVVNRDNCLYFFYALKESFKKNQIDLSTNDINTIEDSDIVLYNDMPSVMPLQKNIDKSYLLIFETELIKKENWDLEKHKFFNKIFTWNDDVVDNKKYFKFNFTHKIPEIECFDVTKKEKLCTLIAGNKKNSDNRELYSKREEVIRWFEKNHSKEFDLYGIGWDKKTYTGKFRVLNRIEIIRKLGFKKYPSYKGKVESKNEVLSKYKFAICYENAEKIPGYITEKIFDCFFAGCIPVYWGAPNIGKFIPKECFIEKEKFKTYEELYKYLKNMTDLEYKKYIENIEKFLKSKEIELFSADYFADKIVKNIEE